MHKKPLLNMNKLLLLTLKLQMN